MSLILAFGVAFQLPVILTLLGRIGIVTSDDAEGEAPLFHRHRLRHRRGADPARRAVSQMSLAMPLLLLYEGSIWSVKIVEKKARRQGRRRGKGCGRTETKPAE